MTTTQELIEWIDGMHDYLCCNGRSSDATECVKVRDRLLVAQEMADALISLAHDVGCYPEHVAYKVIEEWEALK